MNQSQQEIVDLSSALWKACIPVLRGKDGQMATQAIYLMAAASTYRAVGGLEINGVRVNAPKHPPDGLLADVTNATASQAVQIIAERLMPPLGTN